MTEMVKISQTQINGAEHCNSVNARELHVELESKQDFSTWIKNRIEKYSFVENEDYLTLHKKMERQVLIDYIITIDMAKELCMVENNEKGRQARKYFIAVEKQSVRKLKLPTNMELAQMVIDAEKMTIRLREQHTQLLQTKAEIGNRREATAMATASTAVRKASKLEIELDKAKNYCTIKRMKMLTHGQTYQFKMLRDACSELNIKAIDIYDSNYGTVKAYPKEAWSEAYGIDLEQIA